METVIHVHAPGPLQNVLMLITTETSAYRQLLTLAGVAVSWDGSGLKVLTGPSPSATTEFYTRWDLAVFL